MVENFFDAPFAKSSVPPVTVAAMTAAVLAVREAARISVGVNVLRNDVVAAISIAHVCGAQFVRCNVYVGAAVADQGVIEGAAREAVLCRRDLGASVQLWADVGVKHAKPLANSVLTNDARDAVERGLADAIIVSGAATGSPPDLHSVRDVKSVVRNSPVLIGSGLSRENAKDLLREADGAIVGTSVKLNNRVDAPVDPVRVAALVRAISR